MKTLDVAFVWNQHQPFYQDTETGHLIMPWVRLHGSKDYTQMAAVLEHYPSVHQTFNLTPSLLEQLDSYLSGSEDYYAKVMKPPGELSAGEKRFLLTHYFDIQWERVIQHHPRYRELLELQGRVREPAKIEAALDRFSPADYRDLQVWFNLSWIDPETRGRDPLLRALEEKGRNFTEDDRLAVQERQLNLIRQVVPLHSTLREKGQIELITTPYYHPIMPLIIDSHSALRATPGLPLPRRFSYPQDACTQISLAREQFRRFFGGKPAGIWPPEQAVCPELIPLFTLYGFSWTITDEQILARSLGEEIVRDAYGHVLNGDLLYRPYLAAHTGAEMAVIFRDHHLSDRIGFEYQYFRPEDAAADLVHRLHKIRENLAWSPDSHLVTISLDGENAWEWYQGDKGPFLHSLYQRLSAEPHLRCVTVSEHLAEHPPQRRINHLFTGSWVDHNVNRWIGTENKNALWELLLDAREAVERYRQNGSPDEARLKRALRNLYIAEGSDYAWWVDSMPYYLAAPFEALFRKHLANAYRAVGAPVPSRLQNPLLAPRPGETAFEADPLAGPIPMVQQAQR
ncbi:MAG: glycoside hydrolase family 57 protein [Bacillota bacterium]